MEKIGLGGGCHWCTEGIFQTVRGVSLVEQGFIRSEPPADSWAEAVIVHFEPAQIPLPTLVEIHLRTHSATATFSPTNKYRSAVYLFAESQRRLACDAIAEVAKDFSKPIETRVLTFAEFKPSDERFRNYYTTDPTRPFCRRYIDPKLDFVRKNFAKDSIGAS